MRIHFKNLGQADRYLKICRKNLENHCVPNPDATLNVQRTRNAFCQGFGYHSYLDLTKFLGRRVQQAYTPPAEGELLQSLVDGFERASAVARGCGFEVAESPGFLAQSALKNIMESGAVLQTHGRDLHHQDPLAPGSVTMSRLGKALRDRLDKPGAGGIPPRKVMRHVFTRNKYGAEFYPNGACTNCGSSERSELCIARNDGEDLIEAEIRLGVRPPLALDPVWSKIPHSFDADPTRYEIPEDFFCDGPDTHTSFSYTICRICGNRKRSDICLINENRANGPVTGDPILDGRDEYLPNEAMVANPTKLANGSWSDQVRGHGVTIMSLSAARRGKGSKAADRCRADQDS